MCCYQNKGSVLNSFALFDVLNQVPCLCSAYLPVCLPLLVQPHEGERCFLCVLFSGFLGMHQTLRCVCGKLQSSGLVPPCSPPEQTPLTSVEPWRLGRTMPKAQREMRFRGFQAAVNLHPSFLHGEHSRSGFGTQVYGLQHSRNQKLLFPISRAVISTYLCFNCCGSGSLSCFVQFRIVPVSVSPNLFVYMFFFPSSLSPINLAVQSGLPSALLSLEATLSWMLLCSEDLKSGTALTAAQTTSLCTSDVQD